MAGLSHQESFAASPNSSEEIDSRHATPATKLSTSSPDDARELSDGGNRRLVRVPAFDLKITTATSSPLIQQGKSASPNHHDPFFTSSPFCSTAASTKSSFDPSKLSPVATTFTPSTDVESPLREQGLRGFYSNHSAAKTTTNDPPTSALSPKAASLSQGATATSKASRDALQQFGTFSSDENTSRSLMIRLDRETSVEQIKQYLNKTNYSSLCATETSDLLSNGKIYVKFADIRDADKAFSTFAQRDANQPVLHISPGQFLARYQPTSLERVSASAYEGQLIVNARYHGQNRYFDPAKLSCIVVGFLQQCGEILAFSPEKIEVDEASFRVEFCDLNDIEGALSLVKDLQIPMCTLSVFPYGVGLTADQAGGGPEKKLGPIIIGQDDSQLEQAFNGMSLHEYQEARSPEFQIPGQTSALGRQVFSGQNTPTSVLHVSRGLGLSTPGYASQWSPTSSSFNSYGPPSPLWSPYSPGTIGQERGSVEIRQQRSSLQHQQVKTPTRYGGRGQHDFVAVHHNVVDVDRIRAGLDVRTTIMLRNIPNKVDQAMLKDIVDESSLGKYDFMYLRIDFANNCNVGYAFINFEDPIWIVDFVNARAGQRWNRFNSDKVAEVSYATIQGRDCLVQKFRNSSVMYEDPKFRPKLYHTGIGPLVGTEEQFPDPDNMSKMRRSIENAGHIGLFAPRAGQNYRDEQRRRRSQYDRGTRMAEMEDSTASGFPTQHIIRDLSQNYPRTQFSPHGGQHPQGFGPYYG